MVCPQSDLEGFILWELKSIWNCLKTKQTKEKQSNRACGYTVWVKSVCFSCGGTAKSLGKCQRHKHRVRKQSTHEAFLKNKNQGLFYKKVALDFFSAKVEDLMTTPTHHHYHNHHNSNNSNYCDYTNSYPLLNMYYVPKTVLSTFFYTLHNPKDPKDPWFCGLRKRLSVYILCRKKS